MTKRIAFMIALLIVMVAPGNPGETKFDIVKRASEKYIDHTHYLDLNPVMAMPDGGLQFWIRSRAPKTPGDYFTWPEGADTTDLTHNEYSEIEELLRENVYDSFYDDFMLENLDGYEYTMGHGSVHRREYHIYYARGDTIYVISGWLGKFISFYRAIPGDFRYDIEELQNQVEILSPSYRKTREKSFKRIDEDRNYLLENVDKENMMRVRTYLIYGTFIFPGASSGEMKIYNLIEITKFIDEDVMP